MSISGSGGASDNNDQQQYCHKLRFATHGIEQLRGNSMPNDFIQRWREIRAYILSACENNNTTCNSSCSSSSSVYIG